MTHSDVSPLSSLDIYSCLKFESQRLLFESRIQDLCLVCEQFWTDLINKNSTAKDQHNQVNHASESDKEDMSLNQDQEGADHEQQSIIDDDYNVQKVSQTLLEIASTIIDVKQLFTKLCEINPQSVAVLQQYVLVYKYILRDEYRFEKIVSSLGQLYRTNKLEQSRDNTPLFCDSDDYALLSISGDIKDIGRILRVNRGVEQLFGFTPDELRGSKIDKIMPSLYVHVHDDFMHSFLRRGSSKFIDKNQFLLAKNKLGFITPTLSYIKAMVDLKIGLLFVAFFKSPIKVPLTYESKDGGCTPQIGAVFVKTKDAHFLLCDGKGFIHSMSQNCMTNLGLPPTLILKSSKDLNQNSDNLVANQEQNQGQDEDLNYLSENSLVNINRFALNILGPEFEFDLVRGMDFMFDSSFLKQDKSLVREFPEIKNRMCRYNISVTMRRQEYRQRIGQGNFRSMHAHELLLFTIVINSYSFTETPNIIIPVFREEDERGQLLFMPILQKNSAINNDDMRTSKFKEFKAQVQELKMPSKVSKLRKITIAFFIFLLGVFSLNYGICVSQNQKFNDMLQVRDIIFQLTEKVPSTARYVRTVLNIANGYESNTNEVLQGQNPWEDRFTYYMRRISENCGSFTTFQESIYTTYQSQVSFDSSNQSSNSILNLYVKTLQTDYSVKLYSESLTSALNIFLSKALQIAKLRKSDLANTTLPYLDFNPIDPSKQITAIQQDLYFLIQNGHDSIPGALNQFSNWSQSQVESQRKTFSLISIIIALSSVVAITVIVVPLVYPLLIHYELLAEIVLHALNKLTKTFVENEVKCCNQFYEHINHKSAMEYQRKRKQQEEDDQGFKESMKVIRSRAAAPSPDKRKAIPNEIFIEEEKKSLIPSSRNNEGQSRKKKEAIKKKVTSSHSLNSSNTIKEVQPALRRYQRKGFLPPILRKASYYAKMKEFVQMDSFGEDVENGSQNSSQSNYTHNDYHTQEIQAIKQMGLLDPQNNEKNSQLNMYEISQAKSSDIQNEPIYLRNAEEEKKLKRLAKQRQLIIRQTMKQSKCRKLISISLFVLAISIYLAVNTAYTYLVFQYENQLETNLEIIDQRMICYPYSLTILKELISRNQNTTWDFTELSNIIMENQKLKVQKTMGVKKQQIEECYQKEQDFGELMMGNSDSTLFQLTSKYLSIQNSLSNDQFCRTLIKYQLHNPQTGEGQKPHDYLTTFCQTVQNGVNNLGLHEILNFILREEEKIAIELSQKQQTPQQDIMMSTMLLQNSTLTQEETLQDIFLEEAFFWQRMSLINIIKDYANYLFRIFDILFGVFIAALCLAMGFIGLYYMSSYLQVRIVQIYHIVMLIPYAERTKKELNELIKIQL